VIRAGDARPLTPSPADLLEPGTAVTFPIMRGDTPGIGHGTVESFHMGARSSRWRNVRTGTTLLHIHIDNLTAEENPR
jgi:hypothetical protein